MLLLLLLPYLPLVVILKTRDAPKSKQLLLIYLFLSPQTLNSMVHIRVLIAVYKNVAYLKKVLDSLEQQSYRSFQVSVVEDGDFVPMRDFLAQANYSFSIDHYQQEDHGFRKNKILNVSLRKATEELIVFLDGDCVVHPRFLATYAKFYEPNLVLYAKRTDLDPKTTEWLMNSAQVVPSTWSMVMNRSSRIEDSFYLPFKPTRYTNRPRLLGCNMGIPLASLKAINGFDEDYEITGFGEDCDIEWRLQKMGCRFKELKFHAIQFHLYHDRPNRESETDLSGAMYRAKKAEGIVFCKNGLEKHT